MPRAKCKYCQQWVNTDIAYKTNLNNKNNYYCSKDHFLLHEKDINEKNKIQSEYDEMISIITYIFGYNLSSYSLLRKEFNTWESLTTRANIISYLKENKEWLARIMSKEFSSDFHRVKYFSTVIASKLHDYKPKIEVVQISKEVDMCGIESFKYKQKHCRRGLEFLEEA